MKRNILKTNKEANASAPKNYFCMKKLLMASAVLMLLAGCSLFKKSEKLGCKGDGRNVGAEKILAGDPKDVKASKKAKYRGGRTSYRE
jgi:hypothetical protein